MRRFFNTTGPCDPRRHYMLPAEARLPELLPYVEREQYFVVHAPRQTGKTTAMRAFAERLRAAGYAAVWASLERSQGVEDTGSAEPLWIESIAHRAQVLPEGDRPPPAEPFLPQSPGGRLFAYLQAWAASTPRPVVLLLDEADVVSGPALVSLLSQLRDGFVGRRPGAFPVTVGLIGMRDPRVIQTKASRSGRVYPRTPFNITAEPLTLRNFNEAEVAALLSQHTEETGQEFHPRAVERIFHWGHGQPFLTNAIAHLCVSERDPDRDLPITAVEVDRAVDRLMPSRTTHLDSLAERLREERVAAVLQRILLGDGDIETDTDGFQYCLDLGLVIQRAHGAEMANPLYREVLARQLTLNEQENLPLPWWPWKTAAGGLDLPALSLAFTAWWRENAEMVERSADRGYLEAVPHIALMAFLQKVVNGGGTITREYAAGRGRIDLLVEYRGERHAIELKRVFDGGYRFEKVKQDGVQQLSGYLDTHGLREGWLWIFDQRAGKSWEERLWAEELEVDGRVLHLRGA
jgi:hypothetical protein